MIATAESKSEEAPVELNQIMQELIVLLTYSIIQLEICTFEATKAFVINALAGRLFKILE